MKPILKSSIWAFIKYGIWGDDSKNFQLIRSVFGLLLGLQMRIQSLRFQMRRGMFHMREISVWIQNHASKIENNHLSLDLRILIQDD